MKHIILVRHAKAQSSLEVCSDIERPLHEQGQLAAPQMGNLLRQQGILVDAIITSPARRAVNTAELIASALDIPQACIAVDPILYHAELEDLIDLVHLIDESINTVLLVGHNPSLTDLANYLCNYKRELMPCEAIGIGFDVEHWSEVSPKSAEFMFAKETS